MRLERQTPLRMGKRESYGSLCVAPSSLCVSFMAGLHT